MQKIEETLKSMKFAGSQTPEPFRANKTEKPKPMKCPSCGLDFVDWFWLESENPQVLPNQWKPQLCRCMVLHFLRGRRVFLASDLNLLAQKSRDRQVDTEIAETKDKIILINKTVKAIEEAKGNIGYYEKRDDLADDMASFEKHGDLVWGWLFDCANKGEAKFYLKVLGLEQLSSAPGEGGGR